MNMNTRILEDSLIEADNLLFRANCLLKRIESLVKFVGFDSKPAIYHSFMNIPATNGEIKIYFWVKIDGKIKKLDAEKAISLMKSRGEVRPLDFNPD